MVEIPGVLSIIPAWSETEFLCQNLAGHALIAYTIAAALKTKNSRGAVVVTQDERVAAISREYGASVYSFSAQSPGSKHTDPEFRGHLIQAILNTIDGKADIALWLDPCTPLRPKNLLDQAASLVGLNDQESAVQSMSAISLDDVMFWIPKGQAEVEPASMPGRLYRQTSHVSACRVTSIRQTAGSQPCKTIPLLVDPAYSHELDQATGWQWAEWTLQHTRPDIIYPRHAPRPLPERTVLLVLDFDGVITDNRVWVDEDGREKIAAYRSDSLGISYLRKTGVEVIVLSMETNPVVTARCRKMAIPVLQGINDKATALADLLRERRIDPGNVVYLGNDTNDVPCFPLVGCAAVVADAQPDALKEADLVLTRRGGYGAVRELCDRLIEKHKGF